MTQNHGHDSPEAERLPLANGAPTPKRSLKDICLELRDKVDDFLRLEQTTPMLKQVQRQVLVSMGVVEEALTRYEPAELALSWNGGKDCLVLLILVLSCMARHYSAPSRTHKFPDTLPALYVVARHSFPQVDAFVECSTKTYRLDLCRLALPMRAALSTYLAVRPSLRAMFVGTRRTDPHGADLGHFDQTDAGWPDFMRVNPVIDWRYAEIWAFIRQLDIPYCSLYDEGYTSLGGTLDTHPNPSLKMDREGGAVQFRPAYELMDDDEERLGRDA